MIHAQRRLYFHGHGRVRALHVGTGHQDSIQIVRGQVGMFQGLPGRFDSYFRLNGYLIVRSLGDAGSHPVRIKNPALVDDKALLDTGGLFNKGDV